MNELAMRWDLRIMKCNNGYRATWLEEIDGETIVVEMVFEEPKSETGELEAMKKLLCFTMEHFGLYYNKHNKQNLVVEIIDMDA